MGHSAVTVTDTTKPTSLFSTSYTQINVCMCVCVCVRMRVCEHACMSLCVHVSACMLARVCMWVHACLLVCVCARLCACMSNLFLSRCTVGVCPQLLPHGSTEQNYSLMIIINMVQAETTLFCNGFVRVWTGLKWINMNIIITRSALKLEPAP